MLNNYIMYPHLVDIDVKNIYLKNKIDKNFYTKKRINNNLKKNIVFYDYSINTYFHIGMLCIIIFFTVILYDKYQFKKK